MHGLSHQISHRIRKVIETHRMGKAWETGSHTFSLKWVLFSIRLQSCGTRHHTGKAWFFSSVSHSMGKGRKTHRMGNAWEIGSLKNPTKPIV